MRSRGGVDSAADNADFDRRAGPRDRQTFLGQILQMQGNRLARLRNRILDRSPRGRAAEDLWNSNTVEVAILGFLDLNAEGQAARPRRRLNP